MLTIIIAVALIWIAIKMITFGFCVTWGIARVLLPIFIIAGLIYVGLVYFVLPVMAVLGVIILFHLVKSDFKG